MKPFSPKTQDTDGREVCKGCGQTQQTRHEPYQVSCQLNVTVFVLFTIHCLKNNKNCHIKVVKYVVYWGLKQKLEAKAIAQLLPREHFHVP